MKRGLAALLAGGLLTGGVAVVAGAGSTSSGGTVGAPLVGAVAVADAGHDVSAPLRAVEGRANSAEGDREEADAESQPVGEKPTLTENEREMLRRKPKYFEAHQPDTALQPSTRAPQRQMPAANISFAGIGQAQSSCNCLPPDTNGEIGPNDYVQVVNTAIAVYSRTGALRAGFPKPLNAIWANFPAGTACQNNNDGDPVLLYDQFSDRWLVSQFALQGYTTGVGPNYECVAISTTGDPTGSYYRYQFPFPVGQFNDYPKFGVWADGYYATYNMFTNAGAWAGVNVIAYDRASMLTGTSASYQKFSISASTNEGGLLPADIDGTILPPAGAPAPIVEMQDSIMGFPNDRIMIRRAHIDWTTPANSTLSAPTVLLNTPFDQNLCNFNASCIAQPGTAQGLDALSDRIMFRADYRRFPDGRDSLLINGTVDTNGADRAGIRWTELANSTTTSPSIVQQGTYSPDANNRWMASIAQDKAGNIAMGYSVSSSSVSPSIRYAGRLAGDPAGQMTQGEATLIAGSGSQTHTAARWGDYSDLSLDPNDDCTFWYTTEYTNSVSQKNWATRIGSFTFPSCTGATGPTISIGDASTTEGNSGTKTLSVPVTLSAPQPTPVSFTFSSANGTATAGSDYVAKNSVTRTFNPGQTSLNISVTIKGDTTQEPDETFFLNGTNPVGATFAKSQGVETILDDDGVSGPTLSIGDASIAEGNSLTKQLVFTVTLSQASASTVSFNFATADGTALAGSDYVAKSSSKSMPAGTTSITVQVTIKGDTTIEPNETFSVNLSNPVGATILDGQGIGTITNDD